MLQRTECNWELGYEVSNFIPTEVCVFTMSLFHYFLQDSLYVLGGNEVANFVSKFLIM